MALVNAGGKLVDNWGSDPVYSGSSVGSFSNPVNVAGLVDPAPQAVYQTYAQAAAGQGNGLAYQFQVPDGNYTVRLHFVEPSTQIFVGFRTFDIQLQGSTLQAGYDIFADAGGSLKARIKSFNVTAAGAAGISLRLLNQTANGAVISGIEILANDPSGVAAPTFGLELSANNGVSWAPLASGIAADRFGRGNYLWTIPTNQPQGGQYRHRQDRHHARRLEPRRADAERTLFFCRGDRQRRPHL